MTELSELVKFMRENGVLHVELPNVKLSMHPDAVRTVFERDEDPAETAPAEDQPRDKDGLTAEEQELLYGKSFMRR